MKKLITLLLLFTLVGFLSGNQVVITNDYEYIVSEGKTYNFNNGNESNNVKYDRTNKIAIQNNKVLADPLKYHYAFFWDEADKFIGYYKTNKGITTSGEYLGQVNTQSIPLPLNAYSFALVRYDNDYVLVNGYTIEELFIDNNLADVDPDDFNDIPIAELNGSTLNELFNRTFLKTTTELPNAVKIFEVVGNNVVQNVKEFVATETDIANATFAGYTNVDIIGITLPNDFKTFTVNDELTYVVNNRTRVNWSDLSATYQTSDIGKHANRSTSVREFVVLLTKGTTVAAAKTLLVGTQVLYQLTTPITILSGVSINQAALDTYYQIYLNGINATYYATDGNVSTVDVNYFAASNNLETTNFIETTNGTFRVSLGDIVPVLPNEVINLRQNVSGSHRFVIRLFDENLNQITSGVGFPNYAFSGFTYSGPLALWSSNNNTGSRNDLVQIGSNQGIYYVQFGVSTGNVSGIASATDRLISQTVSVYEAFATPTTTLNLTFLFGIGNEPDKATMDGYYAEYEEYLEYLYVCCNIFATQTISFETIYFDDGVSTEIEKLGSILIFTLIGFTLMIFGFASKRRIFNLLSIGAFIVLGVLLAEFAGFLIIIFGLVVLNLYYTFLGDI